MRVEIIFILVLFAGSCDNPNGIFLNSRDIAQANLSPGFHQLPVSMGIDGELLCGAWVPVIPPNQRVPLIVALHPAGPRTNYRGYGFMQTLVQPAMADVGAIIIAPDNPGDDWIDKKSEQAIIQLIALIKEEWPIDPDRIIVTGYSMGGIGTWFMADKHPGLFYAAIPIASYPVGFLEGKVPHYVIQGRYDELFGTHSVQTAVDILQSKHRIVRLVIADELTHYELLPYVPYLRGSIGWIDSLSIETP